MNVPIGKGNGQFYFLGNGLAICGLSPRPYSFMAMFNGYVQGNVQIMAIFFQEGHSKSNF